MTVMASFDRYCNNFQSESDQGCALRKHCTPFDLEWRFHDLRLCLPLPLLSKLLTVQHHARIACHRFVSSSVLEKEEMSLMANVSTILQLVVPLPASCTPFWAIETTAHAQFLSNQKLRWNGLSQRFSFDARKGLGERNLWERDWVSWVMVWQRNKGRKFKRVTRGKK